jgi:hypothetical protein
MSLRERILDDFTGDFEYHPRRGAVYLCVGIAALSVWLFSPPASRTAITPLVFGTGSLALLLKGIYMFRKSSEGIALSLEDMEWLSEPANRKYLPSIPSLVARIIQDFGTGALVMGVVLSTLNRSARTTLLPGFQVFVTGLVVYFAAWLLRWMVSGEFIPAP